MSAATSPVPAAVDAREEFPPGPADPTPRFPALPIVGLYFLAVLIYALLGHRQHVPLTVPDEYTYGHLASSFAHGGGGDWRGDPVALRAALYVYLITPGWVVASGATAYAIAKVISAFAICAVVFPTWLIARHALGAKLALVPAALAVAGTWMATTGGILTENLAYPLAACCLAATVHALRARSGRWTWIAFGFALIATWSRFQLAVLFPIIVAALLIDVACAGKERRERLREHRIPLSLAALSVVGITVAVLAFPSGFLGSYGGVKSYYHPAIGKLFEHLKFQWTTTLAMTAVIPVGVALAAAVTPRNWRDRDIAPLLAVLLPSIALFVLESALFDAGYDTHWSIQRYVEYFVPLSFVACAVVLRKRGVDARVLAGTGLAVALTLLFTAKVGNSIEERAIFTTWIRLHGLLGFGPKAGLALMGVGITLGSVAAVYLMRDRADGSRATLIVAGLIAAVFAVQSETSWQFQYHVNDTWRSQLPADLEWLDHHASGPVARIFIGANDPLAADIDFFNRRMTQVFSRPNGYRGERALGKACDWHIADDGYAQFTPGCGGVPHRFFIDDPTAAMQFHDQRLVAREHRYGTLVEVPAGRPRVKSVLLLPCPRQLYMRNTTDATHVWIPRDQNCRGQLDAAFWLDVPATLRLRFEGGSSTDIAQYGQKQFQLAAHQSTTLELPLTRGEQRVILGLDWTNSRGAARLMQADLVENGRLEPIL